MFQFQVRPENGGTFRLETGTYAIVSPNNTLNPLVQTWAHVAATFDGTTARLYLNGKQVASGAFAFNDGRHRIHYGHRLCHGRWGRLRGNGEVFLGDMDDVGIFNRALSAEEVALVMAGYGGDRPPIPARRTRPPMYHRTWFWVGTRWRRQRRAMCTSGTAYNDVNEAGRAKPGNVLASRGQTATTFAPADLAYGQTYYWRIDEVNATPDGTVFKGDIWSFTTEPYAYPITNIKATASSAQATMKAEKTIDGSGLNANDEHSADLMQMWVSTGVAAELDSV